MPHSTRYFSWGRTSFDRPFLYRGGKRSSATQRCLLALQCRLHTWLSSLMRELETSLRSRLVSLNPKNQFHIGATSMPFGFFSADSTRKWHFYLLSRKSCFVKPRCCNEADGETPGRKSGHVRGSVCRLRRKLKDCWWETGVWLIESLRKWEEKTFIYLFIFSINCTDCEHFFMKTLNNYLWENPTWDVFVRVTKRSSSPVEICFHQSYTPPV